MYCECKAYRARERAAQKHFKYDDIDKVQDYTGCKIDIADDERCHKMMQLVLVQSLTDEFYDIVGKGDGCVLKLLGRTMKRTASQKMLTLARCTCTPPSYVMLADSWAC